MLSTFRPSPAMVVACSALLVSLGGTAVAVSSLPPNSVGTRQLKKRSVTSTKLARRSVTGAKLATGAVTGVKVKAGSLTGADIDLSTLGTVPTATHALSAGLASNAQSLGGLRAASYASGQSFSKSIPAVDNGVDTPAHLVSTPRGQLNANCKDLNPQTGIVDPRSRVVYQNTSGSTENYARVVDNGQATVIGLGEGTEDTLVGFADTFQLLIDQGGTVLTVHGALRADGSGTPTGDCTFWGTAELQSK